MEFRSSFSSHFVFNLIRNPLHSFLIFLLLFSPAQGWAAVPRGGAESGASPLGGGELSSPSFPGSASGGEAVAAGGAGEGEAGVAAGVAAASQSSERAASGLDPELEALIEEEEGTERQEAQAAATGSDGGGGGTGSNPLGAGVAGAPQVDLFTGSASLQVPILIPPGRRGATPDLKLVYSSAGGDSAFGYGWNLPVGSIARNTKYGVPGCPLNESDAKADFVLSINGGGLELKRVVANLNGSKTHIYRPRLSESSLEAFAITDARNFWEVLDRAGNKYVFGEVASARLHSGVDTFYNTAYNAATGTNCEFTTLWMLTRFTDPNGNEIKYTYFKDVPGNPAIYLQSIDYGGNGGSASTREAPFRVAFDRSISLINRDRGTPLDNPQIHPWAPTPRSISYARGVLERRYYVIHGIRVLYRERAGASHKLIRQYRLDYLDDIYTGRNLLQRVRTLGPKGEALVPPQTFEYASSQLDFAPETTVRTPLSAQDRQRLSYTDKRGKQFQATADVTGDGIVDVVNAYSNWGVRSGTASGPTGAAFNWSKGGIARATEFSYSPGDATQYNTFDLTGDGVPDRVEANATPWRVFPGRCSRPAQCGFGAAISWPAPVASLGRSERRAYRLGIVHYGIHVNRATMDMNADGLPDMVMSHDNHGLVPLDLTKRKLSDKWKVYRNAGSSFVEVPFFDRSPSGAKSISYTAGRFPTSRQHDFTQTLTLDVNGDSLPDRVWVDRRLGIRTISDPPRCATFDTAGNPVPGGTLCAKKLDSSKQFHATTVHVYLNSGRGFETPITWYLPLVRRGSEPAPVLFTPLRFEVFPPKKSSGFGGTTADLKDVNGDGLPDFVWISGGAWQVLYNQGGVIDISQNPQRRLAGGPWLSRYESIFDKLRGSRSQSVGLDFFDADGDSIPELVNAWNMASWKVRKLRAPGGAPLVRPGLLVKAHNGLGGTAQLQYRPSTRYDNTDTTGAPRLPSVHWVVSALRQSDGLCDPGRADVFDPAVNPCSISGHDLITRYHYQGGLFNAASREFRGFRMVMATDAAGNDRKLYFSQSDTTRGKMLREEQWIGTRLLTKNSYVWKTRQSFGRTQVYLAEQKQEDFDLFYSGTYNRCLLNRHHPPDDHGRVSTTCSLSCKGAPATPGSCASPIKGQVDTVTTWANPNATSWVRERPSHLLTRYVNAAGALETLVEKWFYYDGAGADGLPRGQVLQGNVKRVVTRLDRSFAGPVVNPTVRTEYGAYGNVTATVDPNGRRTVSDYGGSPFQLYPRVERNALGHSVTTVTDLRYGKPTSVTDPNGQIAHYRYDALGRTLCAAGPLDNIAGCGSTTAPFTRSSELRYVYGNPVASGFQAKLSYVEERSREPWADGNAASHTAGDYVATRQYGDALGRGRFQMGERVIGASGGAKQWVVEGQSNYNALGLVSKSYVPYVLRAGGQVAELPGVAATLFDYRLNGGADLDPLGRPYRVTPPDGHPITTRYAGSRYKFVFHPKPGATSAAVHREEDALAATAESPPEASSAAVPGSQAEAERGEAVQAQGTAQGEGQQSTREQSPTALGEVSTLPVWGPGILALRSQHRLREGELGATAPPYASSSGFLGTDRLSGAGGPGPHDIVQSTTGLRRAVAVATAQLRRLGDARRAFFGGGEGELAVDGHDVLRPATDLVTGGPFVMDLIRRQEEERKAREEERKAREEDERRRTAQRNREAWERYYREGRFRCLARERRKGSTSGDVWHDTLFSEGIPLSAWRLSTDPRAEGLFYRETAGLNDSAEQECRARKAEEEAERRRVEEERRRIEEERKRVAQRRAAARGSGTSSTGVVTLEDDFGRLTYKGYFDPIGTDKLGFHYTYDGLGRRLSTRINGSTVAVVTIAYDTLGRSVQITDPDLGNGARPGTVRLGYDPVGNLIYRDTPVAGERVQWCYDALNRPTARFLKTDGDAYVASVCSNTATAETRYTYDAATAGAYAKGRLARVDDLAGYATNVYDARGRVLRRTRSSPGPGGPRGGTLTLSYVYDLADHVTALTYPDGEVVRYRYNRTGQVVSMAGASTYLKDLQYDFLGRSDLIVHGNGATAQPVVDDPSYYGAGESFRLREVHTKRGAVSYYRTSYAYEERGKISRVTDHLHRSGPLASTNEYSYDGIDRLVKTDWLANGRTTDAYDAAYAFDRLGNMTLKGSLRGALRLSYHGNRPHQLASYGTRGTEQAVVHDSAGRMASRVVKTGATAAAAKSESYFYDAVDRMRMVVVHTGTGVYRTGAAQDSITRYFYDAGGQRVRSQITKGTTTSTTHHFFAEVEVRDGETTKYYFAGGLRIAGRIATPSAAASAASLLSGAPYRGLELSPWSVGALALLLLLLLLSPGLRGATRWRVLLVPSRAVATAVLFWLAFLPPGLAKAALPGEVTLWHYHLDHLGSTHSITDGAGKLYRQTRTTAYGEVRGRYDGAGNIVVAEAQLRHEFTGYESEAESGLQYAGARYYVPELGIFTSLDPAGQFASPYAYGPGDPLNGTDPNGEDFGIGSILLAIALVGAVARALYAGIKTGNWGRAFEGLVLDLFAIAVSYAIGHLVAAAVGAVGNAASAIHELAQVGYSTYQIAQSAHSGNYIGAVEGGLSLIASAVGFVIDEYKRNKPEIILLDKNGKELPYTLQDVHDLVQKTVDKYNPSSVRRNGEYDGLLYTLDDELHVSKVRYTQCKLGARCSPPRKSLHSFIPDDALNRGAEIVAVWHTHGRARGGSFVAEWGRFSDKDAGVNFLAADSNLPFYVGIYVGTPQGELYFLPAQSRLNNDFWTGLHAELEQVWIGRVKTR